MNVFKNGVFNRDLLKKLRESRVPSKKKKELRKNAKKRDAKRA